MGVHLTQKTMNSPLFAQHFRFFCLKQLHALEAGRLWLTCNAGVFTLIYLDGIVNEQGAKWQYSKFG